MNFYEQQAYNRRKTWIIVGLFTLFYLAVGLLADVFILGFPGTPVLTPSGYTHVGIGLPLVTIIMAMVSSFLLVRSFTSGPIEVIKSARGFVPNEENPKHRMFLNVLDEMTIASGLPRPVAVIVPDPSPNAFATGLNTEKSYVAVTEGLLDILNRDELQAVVAHEMGHVKNLDVRLMTIVSAFAGALVIMSVFISDIVLRSGGRTSRSSNKNAGAAILVAFVFVLLLRLLVPLITSLMSMAISRKREYLADATAAEFTRNPMALASALTKISGGAKKSQVLNDSVAHMCISEIEYVSLSQKRGFFADLFSTHPPIKDRVAALEAMAYKYEQ